MSVSEYFNLIYNYPYNKTHFNGINKNCDYMTIYDLLDYAKIPLGKITKDWSLSNIRLPPTIGSNSLVFYADAITPSTCEPLGVVIKLALTPNNIVEDIEHPIMIIASKNNISPKLLIEEYYNYGSVYNEKMVSIIVSAKVIPFILFKWINKSQKRIAIVSLIDKVFTLHKNGYVHNDIKYENIGMNLNGEISLYDFDNFTFVTPHECNHTFSSVVCIPPPFLMDQFIKLKLGNIIIDIFSAISCIFGNILNIESWYFMGLEMTKKTKAISDFDSKIIYQAIYHELANRELAKKDSFALALSHFTKLFLQESFILSSKLLMSKANILLMQLKRAL